ncbi:MAG: hypothetical protein ACTSRX_09005 [Promethearchaeota archaeon]
MKKEFTSGDPFANLVMNKWRWPIWILPLLMIIYAAIYLILVGGSLGYLRSQSGIVGTLDDPATLLTSFVVQPIIVGYYLWLPSKTWKMFKGLDTNSVIPADSETSQYSNYVSDIARISNNRLISIIFVGVGIIVSIWIYFIIQQFGTDWSAYLRWPVLLFDMPAAFLTVYAITYIVWRILAVQWGLDKLYRKFDINVQPLHQDGAGGLATVGNLVGSYLFCLFVVALFSISTGITSYIEQGYFPYYVIIQFILLPIFTCVVFFLPLRSSHRAMRNNRDKVLENLSNKFETIKVGFYNHKELPSKEELNKLGELIQSYSLIRKIYPTWPLNTLVIRSFGATLFGSSLPLILAFIDNFTQ